MNQAGSSGSVMALAVALALRVWRSPHLFPIAYLTLTQATTALLVGFGLLGHNELAADVALVHGATLATFFAFSSNARNFILTTRTRISSAVILSTRIVLLLPLAIAALLLCVVVIRVDIGLAFLLVLRRAIEWICEVELTQHELTHDVWAARRGIVSQIVVLLAAFAVIVLAPEYVLWAIFLWALSPVVLLSPGLLALVTKDNMGRVRGAMRTMLPHFGSTGVTGVSIYVFRALIVLIAGKAAAGDLFTAFAIGSFVGTVFANALGPSISLYEERSGKAYFPGAVRTVLLAYAAAGALVLIAAWYAPALLAHTGKSGFFWLAMGWSLIGGGAMLLAQRVRLRLFANARDHQVFGSEVAMNVCLIAAIPFLHATSFQVGLTTLYLLNAVLLLAFYTAAERGVAERLMPGSESAVAAVFAFCVFFPLFLQFSGGVFNPAKPVWDSGGVLYTLPLPVSLIACFGALVFLGHFGAATPGLWTMLGLLVMMLVSTVALAGASESAERAKLLLMLQVLLPTFGLVLGAMSGAFSRVLIWAILTPVAVIVPAQLVASWVEHNFALTHSLGVFSVYQHQQYVPVVLASAFVIALPGVWHAAGAMGRAALGALATLLAIYAAASFSTVAMVLTVLGVLAFGLRQLLCTRKTSALLAGLIAVAGFSAYNYLLLYESNTWWLKFGSVVQPKEIAPRVTWYSDYAQKDFLDWRIASGAGTGTWLLKFMPFERTGVLQIEGNLIRGGLGLVAPDDRGAYGRGVTVERPGRFKLQLKVVPGDRPVVLYQYGDAAVALIRPAWQVVASAAQDAPPSDAAVAEALPATGGVDRSESTPVTVAPASSVGTSASEVVRASEPKVTNLAERIADWKLFGSGVVESPQAFLLGHDKPIPREVRTSAHNFYIDLLYNFGLVALLPLLALMAYTTNLAWRHRRKIMEDDSLLAHAAVLAFLLLIECNLKVTLRQPYPGIAIYFFWGLLLMRLQALDSGRVAPGR